MYFLIFQTFVGYKLMDLFASFMRAEPFLREQNFLTFHIRTSGMTLLILVLEYSNLVIYLFILHELYNNNIII